MWKRVLSIIPWIILAGLLGYYLAGGLRTKTNEPDESVIDSLEALKSSYESVTDSLFLLKETCDSLTKAKIREVTKYKFIESVQYIEVQTGIDSIGTAVIDSDSVALLKNQELQIISGKLAELDGLREAVRIDSAIINEQREIIEVSDTIISLKTQQVAAEKEKTKKAKRKFFGIGTGVGALIVGLLWIL